DDIRSVMPSGLSRQLLDCTRTVVAAQGDNGAGGPADVAAAAGVDHTAPRPALRLVPVTDQRDGLHGASGVVGCPFFGWGGSRRGKGESLAGGAVLRAGRRDEDFCRAARAVSALAVAEEILAAMRRGVDRAVSAVLAARQCRGLGRTKGIRVGLGI